MLKDDLSSTVMETHMSFLLAAHGANPLMEDVSGVQQVYSGHVTGYAGRFTEQVVEQIRRMPEVAYVEKDQIVRTQDTQKSAPWVSRTIRGPYTASDAVAGTGSYQSPSQTYFLDVHQVRLRPTRW